MTAQQQLHTALGRVRSRWLAATGLRAAARASAAVTMVLLAAAIVDRLVTLDPVALLMTAGIVLLGCLAGTIWALWPLRRRPSDRQVARFVEERCPELEDRVASAAEFAGGAAAAFRDLMLGDAARRVCDLDVDRIVGRTRIRRVAGEAGVAATMLALVLWFAAPSIDRAAQALSLYAFPQNLTVEVLPGNAKIISGQPLRVTARVKMAREGRLVTRPALLARIGKANRRVVMNPAPNGSYRIDVPSVTKPFTYRVAAGSAVSSEYAVTVVHVPGITRIDVAYVYPPLTGLAPRSEEDGGDIYAPVGTRVRVKVHADKPVGTGLMSMIDGSQVPLLRRAASLLEGEFKVSEDSSYRVALTDLDGLTNPGDTEYFIRTMDDRPPEVRILRPAGDRQTTPLEEVTVEARADDDYGIDRFELVYSVRGKAERIVPLKDGRGLPSVTTAHTLFLEDLAVEPGDFVTYYARARDVGRAKRSTEARSDIFFLEVKPFDEEFVAAQSQAMGSGGNRSFDDLAAAQKEIIIATWKLDRRAVSGKSEQDIKAVARAQGELKQRVQSAAVQLTARPPARRRFPPGPAPSTPSPTDDPMMRAAEAMGRAQTELEATRTGAALPHEMEALNQLLKAQADVRRRQVMRQQANGASMGGSNHATQDLSELFDRELQRQQQTNYETRSSIEQREDATESDALDKVRELAKRQDELSQRQRDLARQREAMSEEELKRQLERLTREQSELRRQAEELSRQLSSRGAADSRQAGRGQAKSGDSMRDVSEEMSRAASELRRANPGRASASGDRALEKLRDLERALGSRQPDQQRRALGELQLEAQQLADSQRRVAGEAERLKAGQQSADTARRLAGDKQRLAERADSLEQALKQLSRNAAGSERGRLNAAATEMSRQQIGKRMRESAESLRKAGETESSPSSAQVTAKEQSLARALERVADKIGAAGAPGDPESRKLSDQLSRARELRDRIADLERRLDALKTSPDPSTDQQASNGGKPSEQASGQKPQGRGGQSNGGDNADSASLQAEHARQLRQAQELLRQFRGDNPSGDLGMWTPERHEFSRSAPGTEAFKQDFSKWESLRKDVTLALERVEVSLSQKLAEREARDRLVAGADQRLPEPYQKLVASYYQALARKKK
ncbi:MAG: hypothetical protein HYX76_15860 [Acidobacteria bacterium]|nr:hypothetical protein [Acidobacteriota bacterium]